MKKILLTIALTSWAAIMVTAQNILTEPITWNVDQLNDISRNVSVPYHCKFATNGNQTIIWSQKNNTYVTELSVQSTSGSWANVSEPGQITYTVSLNGQMGTLVFERNAQGMHITLDFANANGPRLNHRYSVISIN
ncbi:MAG: hypothetical protein ING88_16780 [Cytophagales bacterium]|jgi:hypothetical protein|nr:hypothetical protein [Cytophagales bacterium]